MFRTDFLDSGAWSEMGKNIPYNLPDWTRPCIPEDMTWWCERLNVDYETITNTTNEEFIRLNKDWPLRAFVGLLLEQRDEQGNDPDR